MKLIYALASLLLMQNSLYSAPSTKAIKARAIIHPISLKVGQTYRIELSSNPTTGYSWYPTKKIEKNPVISLVKSGYDADETLPGIAQHERRLGGLVGSGGTQFWEVKGKATGSYTITLQYKRPWEKKTKPAEVKKFVITVE